MKSIVFAVLAFLGLAGAAFAQEPPRPPGVPVRPPVAVGRVIGIPIRTCGGIGGLRCGPGQYCDMPNGTCHTPDASGVCKPRPRVCTRIFAPVCGCDGRTYPSACVAAANGVSVEHNGRCTPRVLGRVVPPHRPIGVVVQPHPIGVVVAPHGPGQPGFPNGIPVDPQVQRQQQH